MPASPTSYATEADLRHGDIPLPMWAGDGGKFIDEAADEINAQLGHIYVTPMVIDTADPRNMPSILLLKKINWLLASGRLVLDMAAASEQQSLNAYGKRMLDEGLALLNKIADKEILLTGAEFIPTPEGQQSSFTGPVILNEDSTSLVQSFYERDDQPIWPAPYLHQYPKPYDASVQ